MDYTNFLLFINSITLIVVLVTVIMVFDLYEDFLKRRRGDK